MKNIILILILMLIGSFGFADTGLRNSPKQNNSSEIYRSGRNYMLQAHFNNSKDLNRKNFNYSCTIDITVEMTFDLGGGSYITTEVTFKDVPCDKVQLIQDLTLKKQP